MTKVFLLAMGITFSSNFEMNSTEKTCRVILESRSGTVMGGGPVTIKNVSRSEETFVMVKKDGGKAQTLVNIYVDGQLRDKITFDNGDYTTDWKTKTITGTKNKEVKVDIINQSVGNKFEYAAKLEGVLPTLMRSGGPETGTLLLNTQKTFSTNISCTNRYRIIVTRISGSARATVRAFQNNNQSSPLGSITIEPNEQKKEFVVSHTSGVTMFGVIIQNLSLTDKFEYRLNVKPE